MTPSRIACIALVALISAGAAPAAEAQAGSYGQLLGIWDARTDDGAFKFVFEFSVEDGRLVGKYTGQSGSVPMKDLAFKNGVLTFSVDLSGMAIDFTASVVDDHMTGTLSLQFGEAAFAGTRRKGA